MNLPKAFPRHELQLRALACRRGERLLFSGLEADLGPGQLLALRGANGAGKTTLLLAIAGLIAPESGSIDIVRPDRELPASQALCFLGYQHGLKGQLSVRENLAFWAALYPGGADLDAVLELVGLGAIGGLAASHLSAGQTRRLSLARLVASNRPIWLLDEPAASLDAQGEALLGRLVDAHLGRGGLVVAALHHELPLAAGTMVQTLSLGAVAP